MGAATADRPLSCDVHWVELLADPEAPRGPTDQDLSVARVVPDRAPGEASVVARPASAGGAGYSPREILVISSFSTTFTRNRGARAPSLPATSP